MILDFSINYNTCRHSLKQNMGITGWLVKSSCPNIFKQDTDYATILLASRMCDNCRHYEQEFDWFMHNVIVDRGPDMTANNHSHGLEHFYNHPDLQIVLRLDPRLCAELMENMARRIRNGERFKDGDEVSNIIERMNVRLHECVESGRHVLRMILPDPGNRFPGDEGCEPPYCHQMERMFEKL